MTKIDTIAHLVIFTGKEEHIVYTMGVIPNCPNLEIQLIGKMIVDLVGEKARFLSTIFNYIHREITEAGKATLKKYTSACEGGIVQFEHFLNFISSAKEGCSEHPLTTLSFIDFGIQGADNEMPA